MPDQELLDLGRAVERSVDVPDFEGLVEHGRRRHRRRIGTAAIASLAAVLAFVVISTQGTGGRDGTAPDVARTPSPDVTFATPQMRPALFQRLMSDETTGVVDVAMMPDGTAISLLYGLCDQYGSDCALAYVIRSPDGQSAAYSLPESDYDLRGSSSDGIVLVDWSDIGSSWIVRPDGSRVPLSRNGATVPPSPELVLLNADGQQRPTVFDVERASISHLAPLPALPRWLTIGEDGTIWMATETADGYRVMWSADGGETWSHRQLTDYSDWYTRVQLVAGPDGRAAALAIEGSGSVRGSDTTVRLSTTADRGASWTDSFEYPRHGIVSMAATESGALLLVDDVGRLWRSDPTWAAFHLDHGAPRLGTISSSGAYVHSADPNGDRSMLVSSDDGRTWKRVPLT